MMSYIIEDISVFDEIRLKNHDIKLWTYYNAKKWNPISNASYKRICEWAWREVKAHKLERAKWFSVDLFFTDHDMRKKLHRSFHNSNPENTIKEAYDYLSNPDNAYDIFREYLYDKEDNDLNNEW